jgi:hypothetical protein
MHHARRPAGARAGTQREASAAPGVVTPTAWRNLMSISIAHIQPIVALIAGVLILIMPRLLNIIVALYLILVGILGLGIIR